MTSRPTFGDFAAAATRHLDELPGSSVRYRSPSVSIREAQDVAAGMRGVIAVMARYAADASGVLENIPRAGRRGFGSWTVAGWRTCHMLARVGDVLQPGPDDPDLPGRDRPPSPHRRALDAAATAMTMGMDLLQTHLASEPDGTRIGHSEWASAVTSPQVARATLHELAGWASRLAAHASHAAQSGQHGPTGTRDDLNRASQWLWALSWEVEDARVRTPLPAADLELLHAIPVNHLPARRLPTARETVPGLCDGIVNTAERARHAARQAAADAAWSPAVNMDSLRDTATYCTVTAWNCSIILNTLTRRRIDLDPELRAQLADAADAADHARARWLVAAGIWDDVGTDTRGTHVQANAETADLPLWTGRLAYADPAWTPAAGPHHATRAPASLIRDPSDLARVVAAVHHASHTITQLAESGHQQIDTLARAGRLIAATRTLNERHEIPYRFASAPIHRAAPLLVAHRNAGIASERIVTATAGVAATVRAQGHTLAIGCNAPDPARGSGDRHAEALPALRHRTPDMPGPVERLLRGLDVTSPDDLQRAAAIDKSTSQFIHQAAARADPDRMAPEAEDLGTSISTTELVNHLLATGSGRIDEVRHTPPFPDLQAELEP